MMQSLANKPPQARTKSLVWKVPKDYRRRLIPLFMEIQRLAIGYSDMDALRVVVPGAEPSSSMQPFKLSKLLYIG